MASLSFHRACVKAAQAGEFESWGQIMNENMNGRFSALLTALLLVAFSISLVGCGHGDDSRYQSGYSDGYAEGYNTTCKIRATPVEGYWSDKDYSRGYQDGRMAGAAACLAKSKSR